MTTRYVYNKQKYNSLHTLRQAIWKNEYKCYGEPKTQEDFDSLDLKVTLEEYDPRDEWTDNQWADMIRRKRDALISGTDYYILPDYTEIPPEALEAIKVYRQALRDIPEQAGFPRNVKWPVVPAFMTRKSSKLGLAKASGLAKVGI